MNMLLLTSLSRVMRLTKLARDKGKRRKAKGAISEEASGIHPLPISSVSFISHQQHYRVFNPS